MSILLFVHSLSIYSNCAIDWQSHLLGAHNIGTQVEQRWNRLYWTASMLVNEAEAADVAAGETKKVISQSEE